MPGNTGKSLVVVNPNSANGRTGRSWSSLSRQLRRFIGEFTTEMTSGPGDATRLVRRGLQDGYQRIVAVGGDGTNNEVVNGWFDEHGTALNPQACLGFLPRGTGGDLRKSLGISLEPESWGPVLGNDHSRLIDCGQATFLGPDGQSLSRFFINITSFGLGGLVDDRVNHSTKALGGKISFVLGTLKALRRWRNQTIRLKVWGEHPSPDFDEEVTIANVAVANGQYFGGGMWVAPRASLDDGLFDVVILGNLSKADLVLKTSRIYRGTHLQLEQVRLLRGQRVAATSPERVLIDMDGEQPGRLPITLEIVPGALRVLAPTGDPQAASHLPSRQRR